MYPEDFQAAAVPADAALGKMKQLRIPITPHNYTVWYEYYSGLNLKLRHAVDVMTSNKRPISAEGCQEIYDRFFTNNEIVSDEIPARLEAVADRILSAISGSGKNTAKYGQALQTFSGNLSGGVDAADLNGMISDILSETRAMHAHVKDLQSRVDRSGKEITSLRGKLKLARHDALTDALTGIANRKSFDLTLNQSATHAIETGERLSLIFADIDHFKKLNDAHGHQTGDQVLRLIAQTLNAGIKGRDTAARYGGPIWRRGVCHRAAQHGAFRRDRAGRSGAKMGRRQTAGQEGIRPGFRQHHPVHGGD